ncbi:hypothetical protein BIW11_11957 [Tropilaelaps mercedesae]|uniref:C2H2-type domain-containing protein n=1 Tax=Tropilaelaps mercedesae TaxID=418985 RepID=A0A1V9X8N4_9ACAR|nr:hypothetical protein BIW11_11957 [Tropilaelaps mercedesae]
MSENTPQAVTPKRSALATLNSASPTFSPSPSPSSKFSRGRPRLDAITSLIREGSTSPCQIKCDVCNRVFPRGKSLQAHLRTHTGERPYHCDYPDCTKAFAQSGQLKTHQRLHTGEKPFKCTAPEGCTNRFTHANRHCPLHPYAPLVRTESSLDVCDNTENKSQDVVEWLERYRQQKKRPKRVLGAEFDQMAPPSPDAPASMNLLEEQALETPLTTAAATAAVAPHDDTPVSRDETAENDESCSVLSASKGSAFQDESENPCAPCPPLNPNSSPPCGASPVEPFQRCGQISTASGSSAVTPVLQRPPQPTTPRSHVASSPRVLTLLNSSALLLSPQAHKPRALPVSPSASTPPSVLVSPPPSRTVDSSPFLTPTSPISALSRPAPTTPKSSFTPPPAKRYLREIARTRLEGALALMELSTSPRSPRPSVIVNGVLDLSKSQL